MTVIRMLALVIGRHGADCHCPRCVKRQAHPKRHDDLQLVAEAIAFVLLVFVIVAAASVAPVAPA